MSRQHPYCDDCGTDEYIMQVAGTDIEVVNATAVDSARLRCCKCGAEGGYKQAQDGTLWTNGPLFGGDER